MASEDTAVPLPASLREAFGADKSLYDVLDVAPDATGGAIKKAYFRKALKWHPDKNPDPSATKMFQAYSLVHATLSDATKRKLYDDTGVVDGEDSPDGDGWYNYWRDRFPRVTVDSINAFAATYKSSDEERRDVMDAYVRCNGVLEAMLEEIMLSSEEDAPRFRDIVQAAIDAGGAEAMGDWHSPSPSVFKAKGKAKGGKKKKGKGSKRSAAARRDEAAEAEELARSLGLSVGGAGAGAGAGADGLAALIQKRRRDTGSFLAALEAKYSADGGEARKGKGKGPAAASTGPPDISDEEFMKVQARLDAGRRKGKENGGGGRRRR